MAICIFSDSYTEKVVIPSLKPAAGWLALWDAETRHELLRRDPEVLVLHGDAQSLSVDARAQLIRRYVDAYGHGGYRGLSLPPTEIRRLATPEHAPLLAEIYSQGDLNEDAKRFVLKQMWLGHMRECTDVMLSAAVDSSESEYVRMLGILGLTDLDAIEQLQCVAGDMLPSDTDRWPHSLVRQAAECLYPRVLTTDDLVELIRRTPEPSRSTNGFGWSLRQIAHSLEPGSQQAAEFRFRLVDLLLGSKAATLSRYETLHSKFEHVSEAVIISCKRSATAGHVEREVAFSAAIAHRFGDREYLVRDETGFLRDELNKNAERRRLQWLCEFEAFNAIFGDLGRPSDAYLVSERGLARWETEDVGWALDLIEDVSQPVDVRKGLAWLVYQNSLRSNLDTELKQRLVRATRDIPEMQSTILGWFAPPTRESRAFALRMQRRREKAEKKRKGQEALRLRGWQEWRDRLVADPEGHFDAERRETTLIEVTEILVASVEGCERFRALEHVDNLKDLFSNAVHEAFIRSAQAYWFSKVPPLRSRREPEERNSLYYYQTVALTGVSEWVKSQTTSAWASLSSSQATRAAEWSTLQFNSFPAWLGPLGEAWPDEVREVYRKEIEAEASALSAERHPVLLGMLCNAPFELSRIVAPLVFQVAEQARAPSTDEAACGRFCSNMETLLTWLVDNNSLFAGDALESMAARRLSRSPNRVDNVAWFRVLATINLDRSLDWFERAIGRLVDPEAKRRFGERMLSVFGDRDRVLLSADVSVTQLLRLVKVTRTHIREEDDVVHPGVYTPGARDFAEDARRNVFGLLSERPGEEAYQALIGLAESGYYKNFEDWLRRKARLKAEMDSERLPFSSGEYAEWVNSQCGPVRTADELLDRVVSALGEIAYDLENAALSHRLAWKAIGLEGDLQPSLGSELERKSARQFTIHREPEVAENKKPDYIVQSAASPDRVAIELKLIDKWSGNELVERLENQLIGQYMRHRECRSGVFLLVAQRKQGLTFTVAGRQRRMKLAEALDYLQMVANSCVASVSSAERVVVLALQLPG